MTARAGFIGALVLMAAAGCGGSGGGAGNGASSGSNSTGSNSTGSVSSGSVSSGSASGGVTDDLPGLTQQLVVELQKITDEASAKAQAPKLEALADKIDALQEQAKAGNAAPMSSPEDFAERQGAALEAYGKELERLSNIPGAAQLLQGMIRKLAP